VSAIDDLLRNAAAHAASFDRPELPIVPSRRVVVVACMDARLDPSSVLGLSEGDAHVIRNAGGVVTDDEIRSLAISQHKLGTEEIMLIHHTGCGMLTFTDEDFRASLREQTGVEPEWAVECFSDLDANVRESIARIKASPFIPRKGAVRGFVYDVSDGTLREVL
jgi:carbonic anhydrase